MYISEEKLLLVGVDHGFSMMKHTHGCFPNGIKRLNGAATLKKNTLELNGQFYKVGEGRLPMKADKVSDEDYFILTLAAIAKECQYYDITEACVIIAAGLPFSRFGQEKEAFEKYLMGDGFYIFNFDEKTYIINIEKVFVFPQCYAAIASSLGQLGPESLAVDIGSKTIDILHIVDHVPVESESTSILGALIECTEEIKNEVYRMTNRRVTETQIQTVMKTGTAEINEECLEIIRDKLKQFAKGVEAKLSELGFDPEMMPVTYVGGGAEIMRRYGTFQLEQTNGIVPKEHSGGVFLRKNVRYIEDIRANAIGYEYLCKKRLGI